MEILSFIKQYITKPRTVGAIMPSSKSLAHKMVEDIDFENAKYIIEYGPGTGIFTQELIENRKDDTILLIIEYNYEFYSMLKSKYKNEDNLYIMHGSAEDVDKHLKELDIPYADYIVSGLPFASLPIQMSTAILSKTKTILRKNGKFITFQYTMLKKDFIGQYFNIIEVKRVLKNVPPAYVLSCRNANSITE